MKGNLLRDLANRLNCYISDLTSPSCRESVLEEITECFYSDYSPEEWEYSLSYILGKPVRISDIADFHHLLQTELAAIR